MSAKDKRAQMRDMEEQLMHEFSKDFPWDKFQAAANGVKVLHANAPQLQGAAYVVLTTLQDLPTCCWLPFLQRGLLGSRPASLNPTGCSTCA